MGIVINGIKVSGGSSSGSSSTPVINGISQTAADARYLMLNGGSLNGILTLAEDPTQDMQAATKQYVDNTVSNSSSGVSTFNGRKGDVTPANGDYTADQVGALPITGGTMTGTLTLAKAPTSTLEAATKGYVDSIAASNSNATAAYNQANAAYSQANAAYTAANSAQTAANSAQTAAANAQSTADAAKAAASAAQAAADAAQAAANNASSSGWTPVDATDTVKGITMLNSSTSNMSTNVAATPAAVKAAYDLANTANTAAAAANTLAASANTLATTANTKADAAYTQANAAYDAANAAQSAADTAYAAANAAYEAANQALASLSGGSSGGDSGSGGDLDGVTVSSTLSENTPEVIQKVAAAGLAANYWSVGDRIGIALNGTVGLLDLDDTYYAFIIGFDHNSSIEGSNTIHFQFGKTSDGTDIAFVDSRYGLSSSQSVGTIGFSMVGGGIEENDGGWNSSHMRVDICAEFLTMMPKEWQDVIATCIKYSDNTGGGNDIATYVTSTNDKIWLLSEYEVYGTCTYANSAEQNYQAQYTYYANGNPRIKYKHSGTSISCYWWLRSVGMKSNSYFCHVGTGGGVNGDYADNSRGFAPGFKVA